MAKTKNDQDRQEKEQQIVAVARRLFVESGYDASSMNRIAEEAGVAPNTLYWYFADKDALLVAVLNKLLAEGLREHHQRRSGSLEAKLLWLLDAFEDARQLIATVHARAPQSEAIRTWHTNFHLGFEAMLRSDLVAHGLAPADVEHATLAATYVTEGLLAHGSSARDRRSLVRWLVGRLSLPASGR
jgi:AcrR family transcriptional regulator